MLTYVHKSVVNTYIIYELDASSTCTCLFGAVTLTKNALINMDILVMELDLIEEEVFHFQVEELVKMY